MIVFLCRGRSLKNGQNGGVSYIPGSIFGMKGIWVGVVVVVFFFWGGRGQFCWCVFHVAEKDSFSLRVLL